MDSPTYIQQAIRTESVPDQLIVNQRAFDLLLAIMIGSGQLVDQFKRRLFYGQPINAMGLQEHCRAMGDQLHSLARLAGNRGTQDLNARIDGDTGLSGNMDLIPIRLLHAQMGIFTESGEMAEYLQVAYSGGKLDPVNFGEEVGDVEWYQAIGFDASGVSEASCREANIAKLRKRYPDKFTALDALKRDLLAERAALEEAGARSTLSNPPLEGNPPFIFTNNGA